MVTSGEDAFMGLKSQHRWWRAQVGGTRLLLSFNNGTRVSGGQFTRFSWGRSKGRQLRAVAVGGREDECLRC